jgi:hypothetical protein
VLASDESLDDEVEQLEQGSSRAVTVVELRFVGMVCSIARQA